MFTRQTARALLLATAAGLPVAVHAAPGGVLSLSVTKGMYYFAGEFGPDPDPYVSPPTGVFSTDLGPIDAKAANAPGSFSNGFALVGGVFDPSRWARSTPTGTATA